MKQQICKDKNVFVLNKKYNEFFFLLIYLADNYVIMRNEGKSSPRFGEY